MIEASLGGAGDAGAPEPSAPAVAPSTNATPERAAPQARDEQQQTQTPDAPPARARTKVGDVEWEEGEDGDWHTTQKVDGKEERISMKRALSGERQMAAATQRFQEAKRIERSMETMLSTAAASPSSLADFIEKLGVDPYDFAEELLASTIEESKLTPDQKARRDAERRLAAYEERERAQQAETREQQIKQHAAKTREAYVQAFDVQLDTLHAPKTPGARQWLHSRIAQLANDYEGRGVFTTLQDLAKEASREFQNMTGTQWQAPAAPPAKPRVTVPSSQDQPHPEDDGRLANGRFRQGRPGVPPEPRLDPRNPSSILAYDAWEKRYGKR